MQRLGLALILASTTLCAQGDQLPVVAPVLGTAPLYKLRRCAGNAGRGRPRHLGQS